MSFSGKSGVFVSIRMGPRLFDGVIGGVLYRKY